MLGFGWGWQTISSDAQYAHVYASVHSTRTEVGRAEPMRRRLMIAFAGVTVLVLGACTSGPSAKPVTALVPASGAPASGGTGTAAWSPCPDVAQQELRQTPSG